MEDFLTAYRAWSQAPFPRGSARDDLGDLHGDLHLVDEWILAAAYPFAEHGIAVPIRVNIDAGLRDLRTRLVAIRQALSGSHAERADEYLAYLDLLDAVYGSYTKVVRRDDSNSHY